MNIQYFIAIFNLSSISLFVAGDIRDMEINPGEITHLITILEKENYQGDIHTFEDFCQKYSLKLAFPSQKQMYALYCYYYGKSMRRIISVDGGNTIVCFACFSCLIYSNFFRVFITRLFWFIFFIYTQAY